jgi:cephalosporin hydroxylase
MLTIDEAGNRVIVHRPDGSQTEHPLDTPEAFGAVSAAWLRCGWDVKYVYSFTWLGRPMIQLPDDMIRIQEVIWQLRPDVIVETGVAHGGSLIFYASLFAAMGSKGRVIGVDIDIRPPNRAAIEAHTLAPYITLIQGNSIDAATIAEVRAAVHPNETVLVILDSNHRQHHVAAELEAYAPLVTPGSYIVACDGIMAQVAGAPRTDPDWTWDNPLTAMDGFLSRHPEFVQQEPTLPFNEGKVRNRVTYWPRAFLQRRPHEPSSDRR